MLSRRAEAQLSQQESNVSGETANVWEILARLESILGSRALIRREPARLGDQRITGADTGKLLRHLGWQARISLDDGLGRQVAWQESGIRGQESGMMFGPAPSLLAPAP